METRKLINTIGAALVVLGAYCPFMTVPQGTISYVQRNPGEGYFLIGAAVAAWLFGLANKFWATWVAAIITIIDVVTAAFGLAHAKSVDPFFAKYVSPNFGYVVLILGALTLIISARLSSSKPEED